jgi:TetR/AcrR family transcriptional regulator
MAAIRSALWGREESNHQKRSLDIVPESICARTSSGSSGSRCPLTMLLIESVNKATLSLTDSVKAGQDDMDSSFAKLPEDKRARIVNAAFRAFARSGYRKASMGDIAKEADISKSLLFHYFGSKPELFSYLFNGAADLVASTTAAVPYRKGEDLFEMIRKASEAKLRVYRASPYLYDFAYRAAYEEDPEAKRVVSKRNGSLTADSFARTLALMDSSKLKAGIRPETALKAILWASDGFLRERLDSGDTEPDGLFAGFEELMETLKAAFYG